MDAQEICAGASVWLPVSVPGALIHIGDVHAVPGDGEIMCGGGVECRATVRLAIDVVKKPSSMRWVRVVNDSHIAAIACGRSADESFQAATRELIGWMEQDYGFTAEEAYMLLAQVMEARATQFVNPTHTYVCKMAKKYL
jgi:acetamidase/formamidase